MARILVVYGTKTGCTREIAETTVQTLRETGDEVTLASAEENPDPAVYDAVVVGSGVRAGNWHPPVRSWVAANATILAHIPTAFFTACLTMGTDPEKAEEVRGYTDALIAETDVRPVDIGLFAGVNVPERFGRIERFILKAMKAPQGDFRDTEAIAAWARALRGKLGVS